MRSVLLATFATFLYATSARGDAREEAAQAIKALADKGSYHWTVKSEGRFLSGGQVTGEINSHNVVFCSLRFEDADVDVAVKGEKGFVKTQKGWKPASELIDSAGEGRSEPAILAAHFARGVRPPAREAQALLEKVLQLEAKPDGSFAGTLSADAIQSLLPYDILAQKGVRLENGKGTVTFWALDGVISRYMVKYSGLLKGPFGEFDLDRTKTTEISARGPSHEPLPAEIEKLLEQ